MSHMTESLLLESQSLRLEGDIDASINLLRIVLSQCTSDIEADSSALTTTRKMRQMAAYQLALLLLQRSGRHQYNMLSSDISGSDTTTVDEKEADELLNKLGYKLRLSSSAFGYPLCCCQHANANNELPLHIIDNILPSEVFDAVKHSFRSDSKYWSEVYSKVNAKCCLSWIGNDDSIEYRRNKFVSHNIPLPTDSSRDNLLHSMQHAHSLIEQVAIITKHRLMHRFPALKDATSVEVWCHRRPPDGSHQLHYDMDEIRLQQRREELLSQRELKRQKVDHSKQQNKYGVFCPIVSCVLTIHVHETTKFCSNCAETSRAAPTLVCSQSILDHDKTQRSADEENTGWLCYPKPNRLLAFDGSLLHGVVPGIPEAGICIHNSDDESNSSSSIDASDASDTINQSKRVTLMMGFWPDGVCTQSNEDNVGPNTPFPKMASDSYCHAWTKEFTPVKVDEVLHNDKVGDYSTSCSAVEVKRLWMAVSPSNGTFAEYIETNESMKFSGRFFLNSNSTSEIDDVILGNSN